MAEIIWKMSVPSTALFQSPKFSKCLGRKCSLEYSYEGEEDFSAIFENLIFDGVECFKCTYYRSCSLEMREAYGKVIDVGNSRWLSEIKQNLLQAGENAESLKHLRIYFDDGPCYEFICRAFEVVSEERKDYFEDLNNPI